MLEENHLSMDWGEEVPLLDLIFFAFTVVKFRRRKNKAAWTGKTLATLKQIQIGILGFLHGAMYMTVKCRLAEWSKGGGCWVLSMKLCCFFFKVLFCVRKQV